jgi:mRNA interferase MazF
MKRGEVYLCPLGRRDGAGHELLVPVVVLTRDAINAHGPVVIVAPILEGELTSRPYPSDVLVRAPEGGLTNDGLILTMQLRSIPRHRLRHCLGTLSASIMAEIDRALCITLDLEER